MDKGGGSEKQHISKDEIHLLFSYSLWELHFFSFSQLMLSVCIFCGCFISSTSRFHLLALTSRVCIQQSTNLDKIKCPKTNSLSGTTHAACAHFCFLNSLSLFVFPPSSGSTPSQYAVSVLERKSQIGTSSQKSCCPVQTVGAVVSSHKP